MRLKLAMQMNDDRLYVLALKYTHGIGDVLAKQLISYCGSAKRVFDLPKGKLLKIPGIGKKAVEQILKQEGLSKAREVLAKCLDLEIQVIPYFDEAYPEKLKIVNDSPLLLYYKGMNLYNNRKIIGIVGTRNATDYGKHCTNRIVEDLVPHQPVIISGLAYGIDIHAHKAALKHNLDTIAVIAGGIDMIYPAVHKSIAKDMQRVGGVFSEHPPGTKPDAHHFPARNRIIAGMCDALVVVEAASKGGALISANIAYSYNREVFAVPGELDSKYSEGCNALLRAQKALIYTDVRDIEYNLNWKVGEKEEKSTPFDLSIFSEEERQVINVLKDFKKGLHLDELCWKCQLSINQVVTLLLNLEFAGMIESMPGKQYKLTKGL
ncbi:DNA-processing protein DprA [Reichenbachiella ulvae]|uniref:DNA-processing protein DprA n=1 Tax=Reichenbachiella ulvae TaxID=2980104 RepID=A0ABT3CRI8_9BACT|nr:DNA-processing protein DprA [Reichenbachiella ulvae]MCV9386321.1 DNA-processing protein DprA [Reichenbachiella ulvae]